jgi:hypothetical protein
VRDAVGFVTPLGAEPEGEARLRYAARTSPTAKTMNRNPALESASARIVSLPIPKLSSARVPNRTATVAAEINNGKMELTGISSSTLIVPWKQSCGSGTYLINSGHCFAKLPLAAPVPT